MLALFQKSLSKRDLHCKHRPTFSKMILYFQFSILSTYLRIWLKTLFIIQKIKFWSMIVMKESMIVGLGQAAWLFQSVCRVVCNILIVVNICYLLHVSDHSQVSFSFLKAHVRDLSQQFLSPFNNWWFLKYFHRYYQLESLFNILSKQNCTNALLLPLYKLIWGFLKCTAIWIKTQYLFQ